MKNSLLFTLLLIASSLSASLCATQVMLYNEYEKTISYKLKTSSNKITSGQLACQAEVPLGELNDIASLEIRGIGAYASLNKYVQNLKNESQTFYGLDCTIDILPKQSTASITWNIETPWNKLTTNHQLFNLIILKNSAGYPITLIGNETTKGVLLNLTLSPNSLFILSSNQNPKKYSSLHFRGNNTGNNILNTIQACENAQGLNKVLNENNKYDNYIITIYPNGVVKHERQVAKK